MKAIVYNQFGSSKVLTLSEVKQPVPKGKEVLIAVKAVGLNKADYILMTGKPFLSRPMVGSFLKPKKDMILGADVAGTIVGVGENVTKFKVGDHVFCDLSAQGFGGLAEYVCTSEDNLVLKPEHKTFEDVASVPMASVTALNALQNIGQIKPGMKVLIYGASGGVGTFSVQIAKAFGAQVTAVCSTRHVARIKALGADFVIDYTKEDFTKNGRVYDLIHGANGYLPIVTYLKSLSQQGIYVMSGGAMKQMFQAMLLGPLLSKKDGKRIGAVSSKPCQRDLQVIADLLASNQITPVIAKVLPLNQTASAFEHFEKGHSEGKVIVKI